MHKNGCKIKWNPPKDDGGTPIDHFEVEKFDPETGIWMPAGRSDKPEIEINNLTPGHEYKFRVKAVNAEGASEPLEGTESIIAKNPFGELSDLNFSSNLFAELNFYVYFGISISIFAVDNGQEIIKQETRKTNFEVCMLHDLFSR